MDKQQLLADMRVGRERFQSVFATLDDDAFSAAGGFSAESGWSYKDLLGHVGYWEERVALIFVHLLESKVPPEDSRTLDEINQAVFLENQALPAADVREREAVAYQRLLGLVERASEADLFDPKRFSWTEGLPFSDWIAGNSYGHYEEHGIGF
jgi:hypothetical protein